MRSKNDFWQRVIPSLWLILGIIVYLAYSFLFNRQMLDSDMASEMVLADLLNQEHSIITKNWIYSTEIRVIGMQWFYRVGLLLSSDNWYLARIIGTAIGLILYLLSWKYLLRELNIKGAVVYIISMLIWPFGFWYYYDVIWGGYYIPHSIMMILSFVFLLSASKVSEKRQTKQRVILVAIIVIALLSGLNGVRQAMLFYIPLTLYGFVILAMDYHKNKSLVLYRNTKSLFAIYSFVASFFNILGYGINMKLFVNNYSFTSYDNMVWGNGTNSIMEALGWYFDGFGLFDYPSKSLFSIAGVGAGCGLLLGGVVLISIVRLSMNYKKLDVDIQIFLGVILSMLFVVSVVFTFVWGKGSIGLLLFSLELQQFLLN